jgi:hypothetical protein
MKQKNMLKSRRTFLITGIAAGSAAVIGVGLNHKYKPRSRIIAKQLVSYLQVHHLANIIGASLIAQDETLQGMNIDQLIDLVQGMNIDQLIDLVLDDAALSRGGIFEFKPAFQLETFHRQVRADFTNENIVLVNGWVLSTTEAHMCALLHRYHNPLT